jgi:MFS family permease
MIRLRYNCYQVEERNRYRFVILSSIFLVRGCIGLIWASAGPLLPLIIQEYGLSRGEAGWFASAAPLTIALVSVPAGIIGARFNLKKTFAVGAFLQAGGILTPFVTNYPLLLLTRVCFAAGTAITVPVATAIAVELFTSRKLPVINGVTLTCVSLGTAVAYVATVPLATFLSWRAPITIYGAVAFTAAMAWVMITKGKRLQLRTGILSAPVLSGGPDRGVRGVLFQKSTILLSLAVMGSWSLGNTINAWLPSYYHEVFNMPLEKASSILALITVGGAFAALLGGILPARLGGHRPLLIASGIFMGVTAMSAVLFNNPVTIYLSVALFGIFYYVQTPSLFTIPMELPNSTLRSGVLVLSVMQVGGNLGNFISPLIVGSLVDITGSYLPGFITFAVISLTLLAAGILLPETAPGARKTAKQGPPLV